MKHFELSTHYLRQLVQEKFVTLVYCITDDHIVDIFTKPLFEAKFVKLCDMIGLKATAIMGGCSTNLISPPKFPNTCDDGGVLEPQVLLVHFTSIGDN
jgi:hypothetical protein